MLMAGGIFLLQNDGKLVEMTEQDYSSEELLQELLAKYPSLLAGNQIDSEKPRRWLLICREAGLASEKDAGNRWSVDHLFLDQDAIPTLVEVKRSSDTRIRREVVGQMLDYAANAVLHWPMEEIRAKFAVRCEKEGKPPETVLEEFLDGELDPDTFWSQVKTNMQAGKIRMLFVADEIPNELRRIIEFLNQQMEFAEVLGVEIKQFAGKGLTTLVPRVMGQTAEAERAKSSGSERGHPWDEASFMRELESESGEDVAAIARKIVGWAKTRELKLWFYRRSRGGSFIPSFEHKETWHQLFSMRTDGAIEIYFYWYKNKKPFNSGGKRSELLLKFNRIAGVSLPPEAINLKPKLRMNLLSHDEALTQFFEAFDWYIKEAQSL